MTSLNQKDNTEAVVEHKLNNPGDEEISETIGHELDDPENEEISETIGHELDDPVDEGISEITGYELDDPVDEGISEITGHELHEPGDEENAEVTGDDMNGPGVPEDESFVGNDLNKSKDKESKTYTEEKNKFKSIKKKFRVKRTLFLLLVAGVCLLVGGSYYFIQHKNREKNPSRSNIFPIPHDKTIIFESFILPIQKKKGYTYISLNLLLELSNIKLKGEIVEKKEQLRGIIYDILEQEIHRVEDADALEKLKTLIIKRANTVLTSGEVREAIINNFLLV
jgi:flagellar basal body-associated protein FliL